jgi:hypothetical protein
MAEKILWLSIASMLSAFDIGQSLDEQGKLTKLSGEMTEGLIWYVLLHFASIYEQRSNSPLILKEE